MFTMLRNSELSTLINNQKNSNTVADLVHKSVANGKCDSYWNLKGLRGHESLFTG